MAYDHNKDHVALWAQVLAADNGPNGALQYLAGVAFHWYVNGPGCSIGKSIVVIVVVSIVFIVVVDGRFHQC